MDPEPRKMNELFEAAKPKLLLLPSETLLRPRITRERASSLTSTLRREFQPLLSALDSELSPARAAERKADYEALESSVLVFYAADLAVETPWTSGQKARRNELVMKVRNHDAMLSAWAVPVFRGNKEVMVVLANILRGRGIRDDADDTVRIVALFRKHWSDVKSMMPITEQNLTTAEEEATELLQILDGSENPATGSPRDLRRRAYTVWHRAYTETFHLGRYLSRHDPEAAKKFPAISAERLEEDDDGEAQEPPPAQQGTPPGT
jgi:hypothetical protein